jgi:lysophospholipase L1-like esterase
MPIMTRVVLTFALALGLVPGRTASAATQTAAPTAPTQAALAKWEPEIRAFEEADRQHPPAAGGILFVGSSSIRMWKSLAQDFPGLPVLNRGFGGSQIREVTAFVPRIVVPYRPSRIVFYCGTNDVASGERTVDQVVGDFQEFVRTVRQSLPDVPIAFISAAPNPARWEFRDAWLALNARVRALADSDPRLDFVDIWEAMLGPAGQPRPELFIQDRLHMNATGYAIWTRIVGEYLKKSRQ